MQPLKPNGHAVLNVSITMTVVTSCFVAVRFLVKLKTKSKFFVEDGLIIFGLLFYYAYIGIVLQALLKPSAPGSYDLKDFTSLAQVNDFLKSGFVSEIIFVIQITLVKISILCFYRNIFSTPSFRRLAHILIGVCLSWLFIVEFIVIFQCHPVDGLWNEASQLLGSATCMNVGKLILGYELSNLCLDVCILCLPVYMIRRLKLSTKRKVVISGIFLLGAFVCIACIMRIVYFYNPENLASARNLPASFNWSTIELGFAIICACLPLYGPLLSLIPELPGNIRTWYSSVFSDIGRNSKGYQNTNGGSGFKSQTHGSSGEAIDTAQLTKASNSHNQDGYAYPMDNMMTM